MLQSWYQKTAQSFVHSVLPAKNTLNFSFKYLHFQNSAVIFFLLSNFDKKDKMQLLAKSKDILHIGLRATLNFQKCNGALNACTEFFLISLKVATYPA